VARSSMRGSDIVGRLGGEEFAVIVPEPIEFAGRIAERLRAGFAEAGATVGAHAIGATVSIGAATSYEPVTNISTLIARADAALYRAKRDGRNRLHVAEDEPPPSQAARPLAGARRGQTAKPASLSQGKVAARRGKSVRPAVTAENATSRLPSAR
jgi:predicted signal transduction protein with EAL and GGDEF domain